MFECRKTTLMTICVIASYFLCWGAYFLAAFMDCWFHTQFPSYVWITVKNMVFFNSICNPIIYGVFAIRRGDQSASNMCASYHAFLRSGLQRCSHCKLRPTTRQAVQNQRENNRSRPTQKKGSERSKSTIFSVSGKVQSSAMPSDT